jgi:hypothetical protein
MRNITTTRLIATPKGTNNCIIKCGLLPKGQNSPKDNENICHYQIFGMRDPPVITYGTDAVNRIGT